MTPFKSTETRKVDALESIARSLERLADQGEAMQEIAKKTGTIITTPAAPIQKIEETPEREAWGPDANQPDDLPSDYVEPMNDND